MALTFHRPRSHQAFPPWLLLVPVGVGLVAWLMTRKKQPPPTSSSTPAPALPASPAAASRPAPLPSPIASSSSGAWVTPAKGRAYEPLFLAASARYGLPAGLLSRQASRESGYNPAARSHAGALGIMQIIPKWHPSLDPGDAAADAAAALDPVRAIPYAAKLLREHFNRFGSWTLSLAAYNAGPGTVLKYGGVPPFKETRDYVAAILPDVGIAEPGVRYA